MIPRVAGWSSMILVAATVAWSGPSAAETVLRIGMTAADVPTTTGMPNNGFEGMRFLGYPVFEAPVLWDLSRSDVLAGIKPGLATEWAIDPANNTKWTLKLRQNVTFHDGTPFNADAAKFNWDRLIDPKHPFFYDKGKATTSSITRFIKSTEVADPMTFSMGALRASAAGTIETSQHGSSHPEGDQQPDVLPQQAAQPAVGSRNLDWLGRHRRDSGSSTRLVVDHARSADHLAKGSTRAGTADLLSERREARADDHACHQQFHCRVSAFG